MYSLDVDIFGWFRKKKTESHFDRALKLLDKSLKLQEKESKRATKRPTPPLVDVVVGIATDREARVGDLMVGGSPTGLRPEQWPTTTNGEPLDFIASIPLEKLPTNPIKGMTASVFMARTYAEDDSVIDTWEYDCGNVAVVVHEFGPPSSSGPTIGETVVYNLMPSQVYDLQGSQWFDEYFADPDPTGLVRLGGPPFWIQEPEQPLDSNGNLMRYVCEIDYGAHPRLIDYIADGLMYIFISEHSPREGAVCWQV